MATADTSLPQSVAAPAAKFPVMTLLVCCVVTVLFAVGGVVGAVLYLSKHGKLSGAGVSAQVVETTKKSVEAKTHPKALEPMLINLADEGGHAYSRIGIVLVEEDEPGAKPKEEAKSVPGEDAAVRDTIFDVLGRDTSTALLAPDGKAKLKVELMTAIGKHNADLHVKAIYFTDFLVQR
jgi:flagellar FliL protein